MSLETSVKIVNEYAQTHGITPCRALSEIDHLSFEAWKHTLKGAPKGYQPQVTKTQYHALKVFMQNRQPWKTEALKQGVDISDFHP